MTKEKKEKSGNKEVKSNNKSNNSIKNKNKKTKEENQISISHSVKKPPAIPDKQDEKAHSRDLKKSLDESIADASLEPVYEDYTEVLSEINQQESKKKNHEKNNPAQTENKKTDNAEIENNILYEQDQSLLQSYSNKQPYSGQPGYVPYNKESPNSPEPVISFDEAGQAQKESKYAAEEKLKKQGYMIKDKLEHDIDIINMTKEPNPTGDKEVEYSEKKGIPKYFGRKDK